MAEELHFTRAAASLHISQQALSSSVRKLESELGVQLFLRSTRQVELTEAGTALLEAALRTLEALDDMATLASSRKRVFRLASVVDSGLPGALIAQAQHFIAQGVWDATGLDVASVGSVHQISALRDGHIDLAWAHLTGPVPRDLVGEVIRFEPLMLMVKSDGTQLPDALSADGAFAGGRASNHFSAWDDFTQALAVALGVTFQPLRQTGPMAGAMSMLTADQKALIFQDPARTGHPGMVARPIAEVTPYYAWTLLRRQGERNDDVARFVGMARAYATEQGWLGIAADLPGRPWLPDNDPHIEWLPRLHAQWAKRRQAEQ